MHTIKPIDSNTILKTTDKAKLFVTIEEHNILGGLGSAVSEVLAKEGNHAPLLRIGINDQYRYQGSYKFLLKKYGLLSDEIVANVVNFLNK